MSELAEAAKRQGIDVRPQDVQDDEAALWLADDREPVESYFVTDEQARAEGFTSAAEVQELREEGAR